MLSDQELQALKAEYLLEQRAWDEWAYHCRPYLGRWLKELIHGRMPPDRAADSKRWQLVTELLSGYLWLLFEEKVVGQHKEYPNETIDEQGTKRSQVIDGVKAEIIQKLEDIWPS